MICFFCKGTMIDDLTTHLVDASGCIVAIKSVPCLKCSQCGEVAYSLVVAKHLEVTISELKNSMTEFAIVSYSQKAA